MLCKYQTWWPEGEHRSRIQGELVTRNCSLLRSTLSDQVPTFHWGRNISSNDQSLSIILISYNIIQPYHVTMSPGYNICLLKKSAASRTWNRWVVVRWSFAPRNCFMRPQRSWAWKNMGLVNHKNQEFSWCIFFLSYCTFVQYTLFFICERYVEHIYRFDFNCRCCRAWDDATVSRFGSVRRTKKFGSFPAGIWVSFSLKNFHWLPVCFTCVRRVFINCFAWGLSVFLYCCRQLYVTYISCRSCLKKMGGWFCV